MHPQLTKTIINMVSVMTVSETLSTHTDTTQNPLEVKDTKDIKNENEFSFSEDSVDIKDEQSGDIKQSGDDLNYGCDGLKSYERKEEGTSETESEKELAEFIKSPEKPKVLSALSPFYGKISIVWLKPDQLLAEREMLKRKPLYMYKGFKCEFCIKGFLYKRVLESHMKRHDPKHGKVVCMICNSYLKTELDLKSHYRRHFIRYECMLCTQRFMSEICCVEHYNKNHGETHGVIDYGYNCNKCNYITNCYRSLKRHRNCHKETWQQCKICFRGFRSSSSYNNHMDVYHSTEKPIYECNMCKKIYNFSHSLRYHMLTKHKDNGETFACVDCKKVFASHRCLLSHLKTHKRHAVKGEPKLICDDCGLKFHDKQQIMRHIYMKHMQINRCRYCSKVFSLPKCLKIHIEGVHFGKESPRDKICQYCGKAFTTKNILEAHIRTHTLERPLKCPHCPATFSHSAARYNHKKLVHDPNRIRKPRNKGVE